MRRNADFIQHWSAVRSNGTGDRRDFRDTIGAMHATIRLVSVLTILSAGLGLSGCGRLDLDPMAHREFPKADSSMTSPPDDLLKGDAQ
jgi:hypothetical protein